jgi:hypothetical protein
MKNRFVLNRNLVFFAAAAILFTACKKHAVTPITAPPVAVDTSIYVSGFIGYHNGNAVQLAAYWKNGVPTILGDSTTYSEATAIFVQGADIYVAGYTGTDNAVYWKNGVKHVLPGNNAAANGIFVSGSDVYVCGTVINASQSSDNAVYWKNGVEIVLDNSSATTIANGITVSNNVVYVSGSTRYESSSSGYYWVNGKGYSVDAGTQEAIAVLDSNVYTAGTGNGYPVYCKNRLPTQLAATGYSGFPTGMGIALSGTNIYVSGNIGTSGFYWKNTTPTLLSDTSGGAIANGITLNSSNDVFVAGYTIHPGVIYEKIGSATVPEIVATYWKNGVPVTLQNGVGGEAFGIFIKPVNLL